MIVSFGDKLTKKIWDDESPIKGFSADFVKKAYKKLYYINLASDVEGLTRVGEVSKNYREI